MMKKLYVRGVTLFMAALPFVASADYDESALFTCASVDVMECLPVEGCNRVGADAVGLPRFFKVDLKNKQLTAARADDTRKSVIERVEEVEGKLMLQGVEEGREGVRDGLGWTMSVDIDRGDMVLTASGEGVAFVVFGVCTSM